MKRVFVSYSWAQGDWVWDRLYPCLVAGGAEVLIDRRRFVAGLALFDQIDKTQDSAEIHVLVLSQDYLASAACRHEMERAIALDPDFQHGRVIPVLRVDCDLPDEIRRPNPLYVTSRAIGTRRNGISCCAGARRISARMLRTGWRLVRRCGGSCDAASL